MRNTYVFPEEGVVWSDELSLVWLSAEFNNRHNPTNFLMGQTDGLMARLDYREIEPRARMAAPEPPSPSKRLERT